MAHRHRRKPAYAGRPGGVHRQTRYEAGARPEFLMHFTALLPGAGGIAPVQHRFSTGFTQVDHFPFECLPERAAAESVRAAAAPAATGIPPAHWHCVIPAQPDARSRSTTPDRYAKEKIFYPGLPYATFTTVNAGDLPAAAADKPSSVAGRAFPAAGFYRF